VTLQSEQERLVADTLAFVQRLADVPANPAPIRATRATLPASSPRYAGERDLRKEMQARLEAFRNRQRFLEIEREAHYQQAMQRIRVATERWGEL
jgi:hypothetical protein